jgi:hypothetical protein
MLLACDVAMKLFPYALHGVVYAYGSRLNV